MGVSILTRNPLVRRQYLLVAGDTAIILLSILLTYLPWFNFSPTLMLDAVMRGLFIPVVAVILVHLLSFYAFDLYNIKNPVPMRGRFLRIVFSVLLAVGSLIVLLYFLQRFPNLRKVLVSHIPLMILLVYLWREFFYRAFMKTMIKKSALLLGKDRLNEAIVQEILEDPCSEFHCAGLITLPGDNDKEEHTKEPYELLNPPEDLAAFILSKEIDLVVFSMEAFRVHRHSLLYLRSRGIHLFDALTFYSLLTGRVPIGDSDDSSLAVLTERFPLSAYYKNVKRIIDICLASIGIVISSPFVILSVLLIALESRGPIFFRPERVGENGKPLRLFKLRTMHTGKKGSLFTQQDDPRVTRVGRLIRKFGFDEFPQLLNVLRGDLSLIGPRPIEQVFVDKYAAMTPLYYLRLSVKPGISGWAQVNQVEYPNDDESQLVKLEFDLFYVSHVSLLLDIIIILKTLKKFFHLGYDKREVRRAARPIMEVPVQE
jgi:exopolysaccharide biosynthesis polyprenyl glycosylphosphotransferase